MVEANGVACSSHHRDDTRVASEILRYHDVGNWGSCSEAPDVDGVPPIGKGVTWNQVVNRVPGDCYVVNSAIHSAAEVARAYPEWRTPEVVVPYCHVVDWIIADGEHHPVTIIATTNPIVRIQDIIDGCTKRVGSQPVITIGPDSLIDVVINDLASMGIENMDAIERVVAATGRHSRVAVRDAEFTTSHYGN